MKSTAYHPQIVRCAEAFGMTPEQFLAAWSNVSLPSTIDIFSDSFPEVEPEQFKLEITDPGLEVRVNRAAKFWGMTPERFVAAPKRCPAE